MCLILQISGILNISSNGVSKYKDPKHIKTTLKHPRTPSLLCVIKGWVFYDLV